MKLTKKHLRKLIKEEAKNLLNESVTDMMDFEVSTDDAIQRISMEFGNSMFAMFDEEPDAFAGRSTEAQWEQQVTAAQDELSDRLAEEINKIIGQVEMNLHDGQYMR